MLFYDNSSTHRGAEARMVLYALVGANVSPHFKLEFPCSNNEAEYEVHDHMVEPCNVDGNSGPLCLKRF